MSSLHRWHEPADEAGAPGRNPAVAPGLGEVRNEIAAKRPTSELPTFGHALLFFLMMIPLLIGGQYLALYSAERIQPFGQHPFTAYVELAASDARLGLPAQAFSYLLVGFSAAWLFSFAWQRPFLEGIHFRAPVALKRIGLLIGLGLLGGAMSSLIGLLLPMPKDPPIIEDMMQSPAGAWLMLVFGVTFAPALEELAFRGFLLPGFVHAFDWLVRKGDMRPATRRFLGIPVAILLTSLPFALMHAPQVSHAWGPLLLIGLISVMLCIVRLVLDSLAASMIVHASYNLTLFAGILIQTDGFRHLDKLAG